MIHMPTWLYNDLKGYAMSNMASLHIALGGNGGGQLRKEINHRGLVWTATVSGVILTTMQVQDFKDQTGDQAGDCLHDRKTVVVFLGETISRLSIAFFLAFWTCVCTWFWTLSAQWLSYPPCQLVWSYGESS
jgi:hypothetical protein